MFNYFVYITIPVISKKPILFYKSKTEVNAKKAANKCKFNGNITRIEIHNTTTNETIIIKN